MEGCEDVVDEGATSDEGVAAESACAAAAAAAAAHPAASLAALPAGLHHLQTKI